MQPSQLNSMQLTIVGSQNPSTLFKAASIPMRVVVRNAGPGAVLLAHDPQSLSNAPAFANTFNLPAGQVDTFVLAPGQGIYGCGVGAGVSVSVAVSEALPVKGGSNGVLV